MTEKKLKAMAVAEIERVVAGIPPEPRVVHCEVETEWNDLLLCNMSEHRLHVLARGGDIVFFYDEHGKEIGWRDDGRKGTEQPGWIDRESFRELVIRELNLPKTARLGQLVPNELPPVGWTHQGVFFLSPTPTPEEVVRVWVSPKNNRVIQCFYGPVNSKERGGEP